MAVTLSRAGDAYRVGVKIEDVLISPYRHVAEDEISSLRERQGTHRSGVFLCPLAFLRLPGVSSPTAES
jgi:hypothetical protein